MMRTTWKDPTTFLPLRCYSDALAGYLFDGGDLGTRGTAGGDNSPLSSKGRLMTDPRLVDALSRLGDWRGV